MPEKLLINLNPQQKKAVRYLDGPLLILAGAGSGKTGVLTHKIAYLLESQLYHPSEILAVTFTNKAANEMKSRVEALVKSQIAGMWIGTFHSVCAKILRFEAKHIGYSSNFTIYDNDDQKRQIQSIMEFLKIDKTALSPRQVQYAISNSKNKMQNAADYEKSAFDTKQKKIAEVFWEYETALRRNNAFDFDDLLLKPLDIFTLHKEILEKYRERFKYILVDEYQDTNKAQYHFIKMLSATHRKVCVVGDEDQSIYRWRGADIENILSFESDFPDCKIIRLEQNYRSTQIILNAANSLVSNNLKRLGKKLWSRKAPGNKIRVLTAAHEGDEAAKVLNIIRDIQGSNQHSLNDIAVLYRTNAQSRALEDQLRRSGIPYILVGGVKFYERKEIKDILAYLRVLVNPADSNSLKRIMNYPSRGIGATSLGHLQNYAYQNKMSLYAALADSEEIQEISAAIRSRLKMFYEELEKFREKLDSSSAYQIALEIIDYFRLREPYLNSELPEEQARLENINELLNSIAIFSDESNQGEDSLEQYLQEVSLLTDIDRWDNDSNAVTLMTLHSAKGLEFPVIIITGLEDGLFPIFRSLNSQDDLEEERRLFYVGMTRAKEKLYLLWAMKRHRFQNSDFGVSFRNTPSRFLSEIPSKFKTVEEREEAALEFGNEHRSTKHFRKREAQTDMTSIQMEGAGYKIGQWVIHENFGKGQVLGIQQSRNGTKLTIVFPKNAIKKIIAEYANLEIVE